MSPVRDARRERLRLCLEQDNLLIVAHGDIDLQFGPVRVVITHPFRHASGMRTTCDSDRFFDCVADYVTCHRSRVRPDQPEDDFARSGGGHCRGQNYDMIVVGLEKKRYARDCVHASRTGRDTQRLAAP